MSFLKKAVSASGPIMRVLIGAGAFALLIFGLKQKPKKGTDKAGFQQPASKEEDTKVF